MQVLKLKKNLLSLHSPNKKGAIAQSVEQRTENPCVPGSIPGGTTSKTLKIKFKRFLFSGFTGQPIYQFEIKH